MEITLLLELFMILIIILAVALFLLLHKKKQTLPKTISQPTPLEGLDSLVLILKDTNTTSQTLQKTVDAILTHYGVIENNFELYKEIVFTVTKHPNTTKKIILNFEGALQKRNPHYKKEIDVALTQALRAR